MRDTIVRLLEKYEDQIMEYTLGNYIDEYGERFAEVYKWEWKGHKEDIAYTISRLVKYGVDINSIGFAYIIVDEWAGVMTFDDGDLDMNNLRKVCEDILIDLACQQFKMEYK